MLWVSIIIIGFIIFMAGASVFSFINVVAWRIPEKMDFIKGRSQCPKCGHTLKAADLIPVLSYIGLGGRCRYCRAPIKPRYLAVELLGGALALFCGWFYLNAPAKAVSAFAFLTVLTGICLIDMATMEIPDGFVIALCLVGLLSIFCYPEIGILSRAIGFVAVSVPLLIITLIIPNAFGGGDIKMMAACGIFLGVKLNLLALFFAVITGGIYGIWLLASKKADRKTQFAFGPFLAFGAALSLFAGDVLFNWYTGLLG